MSSGLTGRVAALPVQEIADAVLGAASWREVARRLDLRASRDVAAVRLRCESEDIDARHLPGPQADAVFTGHVAAATSWPGLLQALGYAHSSGSARASVRGRARRLGLGVAHLDEPQHAQPDLVALLGRPRPALLRTAAPALVAAELMQRGCGISWPLEPLAYDLIAHLPDGRLLRVQVKSSTLLRRGAWEVRLVRNDRSAGGAYAADEVDAFGIVDGDRAVHLVPVAAVEGQTSVSSTAVARYRLLA